MPVRSGGLAAPMKSAALALALLGLSACSATSTMSRADQLTLADSYAPTHIFAESGVKVFMDELSEDSQAEAVSFDYYPAGQMGTPRDLVSLNRSGVLDITPASPAYLADQLAAVQRLRLARPGRGLLYRCAGAVRHDVARRDPLRAGVRTARVCAPCGFRCCPAMRSSPSAARSTRLQDLHGLNIRTSGGALDATLDALGAAAVSMPASDAYEALSRKTVDGVAFPFISVLPYKLQEVLGHSTTGLNIGAFAIPYVISEDTWDGLSPQVQKRIERAGKDAQKSLCAAVNTDTPAAIDTIKESGVEFNTPVAKGMAEFDEKLAPVRKQWAKNMDSTGKPGTKVLRTYEDNLARYERASK
jgi:TRAP-type C4-dicarboxylate transport system substrate-binding protein